MAFIAQEIGAEVTAFGTIGTCHCDVDHSDLNFAPSIWPSLAHPVTSRRTEPAFPAEPPSPLDPGWPERPQIGWIPGEGQSLLAEKSPVVLPCSPKG